MPRAAGYTTSRRENYRAYRIRCRLRDGGEVTDIDRAWLAAYEARPSVVTRSVRPSAPSVPSEAIVRAACVRFALSRAAIVAPNRARQQVEVARSAIVMALYLTGHDGRSAAAAIGRKVKAASHLLALARRRPMAEIHARELIVEARGAVAGDVVMVPIVVGSEAWRYLDRLAELDEISAATIRGRMAGMMTDLITRAE